MTKPAGRASVARMAALVAVAAVAAMLFVPAARAQQEAPAIEATHVAGAVWMLSGGGGNVAASVGEDGVLLVDDQMEPVAPAIRDTLERIAKSVGVPPAAPRFVLNTHWHPDHVGGNRVFGPEAVIVAHENVRERLSHEQSGNGMVFPPEPRQAWPIVTYEAGLSIHWNGEEIEVRHLPHGHTDGDSVVVFRGSSVVHTGDLFFSGYFPFVDLDTGGDVDGYVAAVGAILELLPEGAAVIPGHGPLSARPELERFHRMLTTTTAIVRGYVAQGLGVEAIVARGLPEEWDAWSWEFVPTERWIRTIHRNDTASE